MYEYFGCLDFKHTQLAIVKFAPNVYRNTKAKYLRTEMLYSNEGICKGNTSASSWIRV